MFIGTVQTDDSKLFQESNLTRQQPCRAPITLYISSNKCCHLANEGLVNLTGMPSLPEMAPKFASLTG